MDATQQVVVGQNPVACGPRQTRLLSLLRNDPLLRVGDLASALRVSPSTIRRDLEHLQARALLRRVHGGAVVSRDVLEELPFDIRRVSNLHEKESVGKAAAALVKDGETIFIDGGTTTPFIVPHLKPRQGLTVVTVGLNVITALAGLAHITSIVIGGELHLETYTFAGMLSIEALRTSGLVFDQAFISAAGVAPHFGVTNRILDRVMQKRIAIALSRHAVVVVDASKLGVVTLGQVATLDRIHALVTNASAPQDVLKQIADSGPDIILAPDEDPLEQG